MKEEKEELRQLEERASSRMNQCMLNRVTEVFRGNTNGYFKVIDLKDLEVSIKVNRNGDPSTLKVLVNRIEVLPGEYPESYRSILDAGNEKLIRLNERAILKKTQDLERAVSILMSQAWAKSQE